jgi:hypothetical protein
VILGASAAYLVLKTALVASFGAQALHDRLGENFYNHWIAGGDFDLVIVPAIGLVAIDLLVLSILFLRFIAQTRIGAIVAWLVVLSVAWGLTSLIVRLWTEPDPLGDQLFSIIVPMDTEYAPGYSVAAFNAIAPGMTKAEVLERLGPPLPHSRMRSSETFSAYAWSPTDGNYWLREISYDADGRVLRVTVGLWG